MRVETSASYEGGLHEDLRDPEEAVAYLNAAIEDGSQAGFLLVLRDIAMAATRITVCPRG